MITELYGGELARFHGSGVVVVGADTALTEVGRADKH